MIAKHKGNNFNPLIKVCMVFVAVATIYCTLLAYSEFIYIQTQIAFLDITTKGFKLR